MFKGMAKVSQADKDYFVRVGNSLDGDLQALREEAAKRSPGENMALGLQMSDELLRAAGVPEKPLPNFSLPAIWKKAQASAKAKREGAKS